MPIPNSGMKYIFNTETKIIDTLQRKNMSWNDIIIHLLSIKYKTHKCIYFDAAFNGA